MASTEIGVEERVVKKDMGELLLKLEELRDKGLSKDWTPSIWRTATIAGEYMKQEYFFILHRWGKSERSSDLDVLQSLVAELDARSPDDEHVSVSVRRPDGWRVGAYISGLLIFENVEDLSVEPRHLPVVTRDEARKLMTLLVRGDLAMLEQEPWRLGNG